MLKNITIKTKLILLFVLIKIIPLLIIVFIAYEGVLKLEEYLQNSTKYMFDENKQIVLNTANASIEDSIKNLDKKSQLALERVSFEIAKNVANFLYERDKDILFLSKINPSQNLLENFYETKNKDIIVHGEFIYDDKTSSWIRKYQLQKINREKTTANLVDNEKEFNFTDPINLTKKSIPIYKEINYFDLKGKEIYKVSQIDKTLLDISKKTNTYINSETYFNEIKDLKKGEIYVSQVIGEYLPTKVIGAFTKEKAQKAGIEFTPENYAYAGAENPVGKEFEGIIRFVTPVFKGDKKVGYISLALDHKHVMQFTDTSDPTSENPVQDISDASKGNYAFMWDYKGRNISHPRDYFIVGFDKNTGKMVTPWLSADLAKKHADSGKPIDEFLATYPTFQEQSLDKKPNIAQLKNDGNIALDCRYLNFAPQCEGWMQLTQNGGYGSFVIYWSKVWKLSTAATIPYYTGQYGTTKRGFGFVTIGANVDEFHAAANETKKSINTILEVQTNKMKEAVNDNKFEIEAFIHALINELSVVTLVMILLIIGIAIAMSNYITSKIQRLLIGTQKFSNNELDYQIEVTSNDEIGNLEKSFNTMASQIKESIKKQDEALSKAKKADEAKSTFLANISHEIRTPLNAIIGFSEVLSNSSQLDKSNLKYANIIKTSANSLLSIINDILDISKIENGNFEVSLKPVDIKVLGEETIELFSKKSHEKSQKLIFNFDYNTPNMILSDSIRMKQVISNLLSNAIKFTPTQGTITLDISTIKKDSSKAIIRFEVEDTGIGIENDQLETILEPFIQIDHKSNRSFEGTGLGLSISSHIIKAFGSEIQISSVVNKGTKFYFDIEAKISDNSSKDTPKKFKFFVTDTNNELYKYIKNHLENISTSVSYEEAEIIICTDITSIDDLERSREDYPNKKKVILVEDEKLFEKTTILSNEQLIQLPFYETKILEAISHFKDTIENQNKPKLLDKKSYKGKILIVEDNLTNQALISHIMDDLGLEFVIKNNGLEAFESFKETKYDLVLMDINMPVLDGVESFKKIKEYELDNKLSHTPVIAVTANAIKGDKEQFLNLGMDDYLSKPLSTTKLHTILDEYLDNKTDSSSINIDKEIVEIKLDPQIIVDKIGISENIAKLIIEKFKKEILKDLDELEKFIENKDYEEIKGKAHYIKNSTLNVGLEEISNILQSIEAPKELSTEELKKQFFKIKFSIERVI